MFFFALRLIIIDINDRYKYNKKTSINNEYIINIGLYKKHILIYIYLYKHVNIYAEFKGGQV